MATHIDVLVHKAKNAPNKKSWRGAPSERQKAQEELLQIMEKKDHWILLANYGETKEIREKAVDRWIMEGLGSGDALNLFLASKDSSVKMKIIALFGKEGSGRSASNLWSIIRHEPESPCGKEALKQLFQIAKDDAKTEAAKREKLCALNALKSLAHEEKGECAREAFDHLWHLDQLEMQKSGKQFTVLSIPNNITFWVTKAKNPIVQRACKSLLK